jgi:hypothetical protein
MVSRRVLQRRRHHRHATRTTGRPATPSYTSDCQTTERGATADAIDPVHPATFDVATIGPTLSGLDFPNLEPTVL